MKVVCPHCGATYNIDDARVPEGGLNVRCPKCRDTFPVRKGASRNEAAVPPPAPAAPPRGPPPIPKQGAKPLPVPLPSPAPAGRLAGTRAAPPAGGFGPAPEAVPLPAPSSGATHPAATESFDVVPQEPLPAAPDPYVAAPKPPASGAGPFPSVPDVPLPELVAPEPQATPAELEEPLAFGEIDIGGPESPVAPAPLPDPFAAPSPFPGLRSQPSEPTSGEELEMLFGDGAARASAQATHGKALAYKVRRRSGKIFGPFDEAQIVEMIGNAELLGNEDVSTDGGATWSPIGGVLAFGEALRKSGGEPPPAGRSAPAQRAMPFGDRMAGAKVVAEEAPTAPRPKKKLAAAAAVLLVAALAAGAAFTPYGSFLMKPFRRGDAAKVAAFLAEARAALDRAEFPAARAALDSAARAVAADPESAEAAAMHAMVVAALELRHGAPPQALDQARRAADRLEASAVGTVPALAARLAVSLFDAPGASTRPQETALEQASAKAAPDADVIALLASSALARGDGSRAAALFARLEAIRPGTPRAGHGKGLALLAKHDLDGARAALEKVLAAVPGHLASRLELAALEEADGNTARAETHLAALLAPEAEAQLAPAERARALVVKGALLARARPSSEEADQALAAAVEADPRLLDARVALSRRRLRRGDAAGAVAVLDPVVKQAAAVPALAAARIRALAAAGRALDASSLAGDALQRNPGDPALLVAKAVALAAAGKVDDAAALYRDAAARDPAAFEPHLALGRIALARSDLAHARVELAAAAEKGPREPGAHAALAELAAAAGDGGAAEKGFQAALALDAEYAPAHIGLAKLALARGDGAEARARIERVLAADPQSVEGHVALGRLLWRAKDLTGAEEALRAALALQPRSAVVMWQLGAVQLERGENVDEAVKRLTEASNEEPQHAEIRQWLGRALLRRGETQGAIAQLRRAVELDPKNPEHHLHLGAALERSGSILEAIDEYRAAAAADPKLAEPHERLGLVFAANGRFDEAAAAYEKAIAAAPRVSRLRIALADCHARLGKHKEALRAYRAVLKVDPKAKQVPYKLARALHETAGARAALPWYERAARDERDNPMPHYYLGYLYKARGRKAKAAAEFKRFLSLKPDADERKDIEAEIEDLR